MSLQHLYARAGVDIKIMMNEITGEMAAIQPPNPACFNVAVPKSDNCKAHFELLNGMFKTCATFKTQATQALCYCRWGVGPEIIGAVEPCVRDSCKTEEEIQAALDYANGTQATYEKACSKWMPIAITDEPETKEGAEKVLAQIKANHADEEEGDGSAKGPKDTGSATKPSNETGTETGPDKAGETSTLPDSAGVSIGIRLRDVAVVGMLVASVFSFGGL